MSLAISMTLAGSIVISIYIILRPLLIKKFNTKFRYLILSMALFFYIIPFQIGKNIYVNIWRLLFVNNQESKVIDLSKNVIQKTLAGQVYYPIHSVEATILIVWVIVAIIIICIGFIIYLKQKKIVIRDSEIIHDAALLYSIETVKKILGIRRKIIYKTSYNIKEPLTVGIFQPILLLPKEHYNKEESNFIYVHELLHIKNFDTLFKLLGLLAIGINWYNPFSYFLFHELNIINENICDELIVLDCEKEQRMVYVDLILRMVTERRKINIDYPASFSNNKKRVKERIVLIMKAKRLEKKLRLLGVCLLLMIGLTSSLTVFAYEKPIVLTVENLDEVSKNNNGEEREAVFLAEDFTKTEEVKSNFAIESSLEFANIELPGEQYFQDQSGNMFEKESRNTQKKCNHTFINGTYNEHQKDGNSCTIYIYQAKRCSKCGNVVKGSLDQKNYYAKCTH